MMSVMASQITSTSVVCATICSSVYQRKHQSSASLAFVRGTHQLLVDSLCKWPVMWKMFPFDKVIMTLLTWTLNQTQWGVLSMCYPAVTTLVGTLGHLVKSSQLISGTHTHIYIYIILWVLDLSISCSDLKTGHQYDSLSNGHQFLDILLVNYLYCINVDGKIFHLAIVQYILCLAIIFFSNEPYFSDCILQSLFELCEI